MRKPEQGKRFGTPKMVLAFGSNLILKAVFHSLNSAEALVGVAHQQLCNAISGERISAKGFYWREVDEKWEIEQDDIGTLSLLDYDAEMKSDRLIYATRYMRRGQEILESQYNNRHNLIKSNRCRKSRLKQSTIQATQCQNTRQS